MISVEFYHRVTITSALPYVNGVKHLGNIAGSLLPADIFHRFLDIFGVNNIFICGTDDHGTAVEIAAAREGLTFEEYAQKYYEIQKAIYKRWNFDFTYFGKTSTQSHHDITKEIFLTAYKNGYIIEKTLVIPYCTHDKRFLPDRYTLGTCPACGYTSARGDQCEKCGRVLDPTELINARCAVCDKQSIEFREEKHLFLDFASLQDKLRSWIEGKNWPDATKNFALGWLNEGLKPRCITRNLKWGVQVPLKGYEHLVFYVWFDAPIGYISITKEALDKSRDSDWRNEKFRASGWREWWTDSHIYNFIGKDNVPFHTIFFPGSLMAAYQLKYSLPHYVTGYEYLNWENEKFSTSKGVGLFSDEALDLFPADYWRFYLSSILPETKDSNFDWNDFQSRVNNELIANFGNLFYRATYFIEKNFNGAVPEAHLTDKERELQWHLEQTIIRVRELVHGVKLREALRETLSFASQVNKYFQDQKPWDKIRTDPESAATTLYTTINLLHQISILLSPYIPESASMALDCLGGEKKLTDKFLIGPGQKITAKLLFKKIEDAEIEKVKNYRTKYVKKDVTEKGINRPEDKSRIKVSVSPELQKLGVKVKAAIFSDANIVNRNPLLEKLKEETSEKLKNSDTSKNSILQAYRELHKKSNVTGFLPPAESLIDLIKNNGKLPNINSIVDSYNLVSAETSLSIGAHDVDKIRGDLQFRITDGSEHYIPLGSKTKQKTNPGEYACCDEEKVICWLDIKQCEETKITKDTKAFLIYIQGNKNTSDQQLENALKKVIYNLSIFCKAKLIWSSSPNETDSIEVVNNMLPFKEFSKVEMKVGTITAVNDHPNADKLYVLEVDLGEEHRQLVAGLRLKYTKEDLIGKQIIVVMNLEPRELRGIRSHGMLLAADDGTVLGPSSHVKNGSKIM